MSKDNNPPQNTSERRVTTVSNNKSSSSSSKTRRITKKLNHLISEYDKSQRKHVHVPILCHEAEVLIAALQSANKKIMTHAGELNLVMQRYSDMRMANVELQLKAKIDADATAEREEEDKDDAAHERIRLIVKVTGIRIMTVRPLSEAQDIPEYYDAMYWEYLPWDSEINPGYHQRALTPEHIEFRIKHYWSTFRASYDNSHCVRVDVPAKPTEHARVCQIGGFEDALEAADLANGYYSPSYWSPTHGIVLLNGGKPFPGSRYPVTVL